MKTDLTATRVIPILGDPVAQVSTPGIWNAQFARTGQDAVCVPISLPAQGLDAFVAWVRLSDNLPGFLTTIPHKAALTEACDRVEPDAQILGVVNTIRRDPDGTLIGEMFDGHGMLDAIEATGARIRGARIALCGAGAAGSAIAIQAIRRGAAGLFISDMVPAQAEALVARLAGLGKTELATGPAEMADAAEILINASPAGSPGMLDAPFPAKVIEAATCVADAVTDPAETVLIALARAAGVRVVQGAEMAAHQGARMRAFLGLEAG
ncbi:shikimate dehydrogenase family protein [Pseudooceanicola algae]|uniref:Shikimate dehydrogenase n=1 Tax=Pseudooceanicola algae TaxID=1537215 RepID=A0A418SD49_9RHOB|nr:shikimate dehydrogenase [Pseudooceanicola algae]QPM92287.1 Shikimate dehydrogenase [Pseudooceanicola algae]